MKKVIAIFLCLITTACACKHKDRDVAQAAEVEMDAKQQIQLLKEELAEKKKANENIEKLIAEKNKNSKNSKLVWGEVVAGYTGMTASGVLAASAVVTKLGGTVIKYAAGFSSSPGASYKGLDDARSMNRGALKLGIASLVLGVASVYAIQDGNANLNEIELTNKEVQALEKQLKADKETIRVIEQTIVETASK